MNSAELTTFIAVAQLESTSSAAEQLHVSQPAVTRRIQSLESSLETPLFDRVGKRLQLNQAGRTFLPRAQQILSTWQDSHRQLKDLSDTVSGNLHLATSHHIGLHRLAPVLAHYRGDYPTVQLNISFEDSEVAHDLVRDGKIELAIATLDPSGPEGLTVAAVWHDPLVFVSTTHPSASLTELAEMPCVLPGIETYTGRIVTRCFRDAGISLTPEMSTNYLETIHMLVGVGVGWSVLPQSMLGSLEAMNITDLTDPLFRTLGTITHPQRELSNAGSAFLEVVAEYADAAQ